MNELMEEFSASLKQLQHAVDELWQKELELGLSRRELILERDRHRQLIEFLPDAYLVTSTEGKIWYANSAATAVLGVSPVLLPGQAMGLFLASKESGDVLATFLVSVRNGEAACMPLLVTSTGGAVEVAVRVAAIKNAKGEAIGLHWLLRNRSSAL